MAFVHASAVCLSLVLMAPTAARQEPAPADAPPPPARAAGGEKPPPHMIRGGGGVGFGAPHRDDQLHALRQILEAGDDEWKNLSPKLEKLLDAKANMNTGAGMNWTRSNNQKPAYKPSAAQPDTAAGRAMQDVRDAVADKDASAETLTTKMAAVRAERKRARAEYEAAEKELIAAVTPRQQAVLMTVGVVE